MGHGERIYFIGRGHNCRHNVKCHWTYLAMHSHGPLIQWFWLTLDDLQVENHGTQTGFLGGVKVEHRSDHRKAQIHPAETSFYASFQLPN